MDDEDAEREGRDKQVEAEAATGNKVVGVEEEEPAQMATPGTRRAVREDPCTGEMVSSHDSNEKLTGVCVRIFREACAVRDSREKERDDAAAEDRRGQRRADGGAGDPSFSG